MKGSIHYFHRSCEYTSCLMCFLCYIHDMLPFESVNGGTAPSALGMVAPCRDQESVGSVAQFDFPTETPWAPCGAER